MGNKKSLLAANDTFQLSVTHGQYVDPQDVQRFFCSQEFGKTVFPTSVRLVNVEYLRPTLTAVTVAILSNDINLTKTKFMKIVLERLHFMRRSISHKKGEKSIYIKGFAIRYMKP